MGSAAAGLSLGGVFPSALKAGPLIRRSGKARRVLVLGIDGMDPGLLERFMAEGIMPTFKAFGEQGHLGQLRTTTPPQSPVAWASFITGANPGKHGIFDFVHRDAATFTPYLSTSRTFAGKRSIKVGNFIIPLESSRVELLRRGTPFWSYLEDQDIPANFSQLPANFPVQPSRTTALSGMGTPDLLGTYGTFTFYTDQPDHGVKEGAGARVVRVKVVDDVVRTSLKGPKDTFRAGDVELAVDLAIFRDSREDVARIQLGDEQLVLKAGEWSEWVPLRFEMIPFVANFRGMVRLFVQQLHPYLRLYVSPINADPMESAIPISCPEEHSRNLAARLGRFYTQGFPEDTKALSNGLFSDTDFFTQAKIVLAERMAALEYELDNFKEGLLFFYFSTVDQNSHMLLRAMDPSHPLYDSAAPDEIKNAIRYCYSEMDEMLRFTLSRIGPDTAVYILSDHGFAPFTREVNLSTWLAEGGYTSFTDRSLEHTTDLYRAVNWRKTKAYVLGINGIYLNLKGREENGSVEPAKAAALKKEIIAALKDLKDPANGVNVFRNVYDSSEAYSGPWVGLAPDIVVGYESGYRISDESVLGKFPEGIFAGRRNKWSADHCMDPSVVPGVLLANKRIVAASPAIWDLAPTILKEFGIDTPGDMDGKALVS